LKVNYLLPNKKTLINNHLPRASARVHGRGPNSNQLFDHLAKIDNLKDFNFDI